jgi:hypothetical protein
MIGIYTIERIYSENGTLQIVRSDNERQTRCSFQTLNPVYEWDEIIVENDYSTRLFAGILESPEIKKANNVPLYTAQSGGYKKLFDRRKVADSWEGELAGDIVRDIVADFAAGFTSDAVEDGSEIEKVVFNYVLPSEAIGRVASSLGLSWGIDFYKDVKLVAEDAESATQHLTTGGAFWKNLVIKPDVSSLYNVVIVRGGTYLSEQVIYTEVADGEKTKFVLPEKPHDVEVYVNSVSKTVGIQFGEATPTAEFQINFNEKYIENGTHAVLADGDVLEVRYKYDVPIRVRRKNLASINALKALFPETNGEFELVIQDASINTRELAYNIAQQNLNKYSNALVSGSFDTDEDIYNAGQVLNITVPEFVGSALIQSVNSRHLGGTLWRHSVQFATVLFGFEEFMRELLSAKKVQLIDGETLETSHDYTDGISLSDSAIAGTDINQAVEQVDVSDDSYSILNTAKDYVLGYYFPSSFTDTKRVFILDGSPLG